MKEELIKVINVTQQLTNKIVNIKQKANTLLSEEDFELLNNKFTELLNKCNTKRKLYVLSLEEMQELYLGTDYESSQYAYLTYDQQTYQYAYLPCDDMATSFYMYLYNTDSDQQQRTYLQYIEIENASNICISSQFFTNDIMQLSISITDQNLNHLYSHYHSYYLDNNSVDITLPSIPTTSNYKIYFVAYPIFQLFGKMMKISGFTDEYQLCNNIYEMYIYKDIYNDICNLLLCHYTDNFLALYKQQSGIWRLVIISAEKMDELYGDYDGGSAADIINFASQHDGIELPNFSLIAEDQQLFYDNSTLEKQKFFKCIEGTYTYTQKDTNITHTITIQPYTVLDLYNQYY